MIENKQPNIASLQMPLCHGMQRERSYSGFQMLGRNNDPSLWWHPSSNLLRLLIVDRRTFRSCAKLAKFPLPTFKYQWRK
jgi:hypothetical protein